MYSRLLNVPNQSFFLLGARGAGKSTWIKQNFSECKKYDLLSHTEVIRLSKDPSQLYRELHTLPPDSWVVIDEVQKVPALLDEVHRLIEDHGLKFVLCGSSARKLKRSGANLLAGRALMKRMHPIVSGEMVDVDVERLLLYGALPTALNLSDPIPYLQTYAEVYLREEIMAEALTRNLGSFSRFLEIAARQNAQITNMTDIARDAQIVRQTVTGFFEVLIDTLMGFFLPAWKLKGANRQVGHSKFYFFDVGVVRALSTRLPYPPSPEEMGSLLETWIINEFRAAIDYQSKGYQLHYWRDYQGSEVDLICETTHGHLAIEIKSSKIWKPQFSKGLHKFREILKSKKLRTIGIYLGEQEFYDEQIEVMTVKTFLKQLWNGELL